MRRLYYFALFLVIFEFTAYSANDMIMPGMIQVVREFNASQNYVALSLSLYLLGNCCFMLFLGFLAERYGKGNLILLGNLGFLLFTLLIMSSRNITEFMMWRYFQGSGLAIIAIGYALIHENFNDKNAVKLTALMANVAILAPLLGPAIGSAVVSYLNWHYIFIITAVLSTVSLIGIYLFKPEGKHPSKTHLPINWQQYWKILQDNRFLLGTLCTTFAALPALIWISQAPNLILYKLQQSYLHFAIYQILGIGGLALSSIALQFIAGRYRIHSLIKVGNFLMLIGLFVSLIGSYSIVIIVAGLFIYTLGLGIANGCMMRLIMSIKEFPTAMVASMLGFIQTLFFVIGITLINSVCHYFDFSLWSYTMSAFSFGLIGFLLVSQYILWYRDREWE